MRTNGHRQDLLEDTARNGGAAQRDDKGSEKYDATGEILQKSVKFGHSGTDCT